MVHYCSKAHQQSDWKTHKKTCFPPGSICTRCNEPTASSQKCLVAHPSHFLQGAGSQYGPDGTFKSFVCGACGKGFTLASPDRTAHESEMTTVRGPQWCYSGSHTIKPVSGNRRVFTDVVVLSPGCLQQEIDALDGDNVRVLKIYSGGSFDDTEMPKLNHPLPALEELQIEAVDMGEITLNAALTPKLKSIKMQNVSDECKFDTVLPTLEVFHMYYYGPPNDHTMVNS